MASTPADLMATTLADLVAATGMNDCSSNLPVSIPHPTLVLGKWTLLVYGCAALDLGTFFARGVSRPVLYRPIPKTKPVHQYLFFTAGTAPRGEAQYRTTLHTHNALHHVQVQERRSAPTRRPKPCLCLTCRSFSRSLCGNLPAPKPNRDHNPSPALTYTLTLSHGWYGTWAP